MYETAGLLSLLIECGANDKYDYDNNVGDNHDYIVSLGIKNTALSSDYSFWVKIQPNESTVSS